jgi:type IV secretion system protein VirD4
MVGQTAERGGRAMQYLWIIGAIVGLIALLFRYGATLHHKGHLIPVLLMYVGIFGAVLIYDSERATLTGILAGLFSAPFFILFGVLLIKAERKRRPEVEQAFKNVSEARAELKELIEKRKKAKASKKPTTKRPEPHGVVFGKNGRKWVYKDEETDGHILVTGGVGSGKTSCVVIPTLRAWSESIFAIDIKGELLEHSRDYRPYIKVFNPLDDKSCGFDPFHSLRNSQNLVQDARAIAQAIVPLPPDTREPFWIENAQNIFTGSILHYFSQGFSFLDTLRKMQSVSAKSLVLELTNSHKDDVRYCVNSLVGLDSKTLSGFMAEISKNIVPLITDKNLTSALSRTRNITPEDLECGTDIFIQIPEHLLSQWKSLLTLIVNQFLRYMEQRSESDAQPILFLLDEFPRLGKISAMLDGLATLRSKKICMCLVIQSLAQLDLIYGKNERKVICDTCAYKAILGASDTETQRYFSELVGTYEKTIISRGKQYSLLGGSDTLNEHEEDKPRIKPHEFGQLDDIVLVTPKGMERVKKTPWYDE